MDVDNMQKLAELTIACRSGDPKPVAHIDNDSVYVTGADGEKIFDMHPAEMLEAALDLLGIPNEPV